jgi:hypothetical protein
MAVLSWVGVLVCPEILRYAGMLWYLRYEI